MKFVAFERGDDKDLDAAAPHSGGHQLHSKAFPGAAGSKQCDIGIFINAGIKDIYDD